MVKTLEEEKNRSFLKKSIYQTLNKYFYEKTNRSPLILIEIMEIPVLSPV